MIRFANLAPYLFVVFTTGACSLIYQVVWQKYLSILIGSEAKSNSLIVGVFLAGIALGYFIWGKVTLRVTSRKQLLKSYGFVELATGAYAILFPQIFELALPIAKSLPNMFIFDLLVCVVLILPPTFLMGATVPMLTCCLPNTSGEVDNLHSKIYGVNTLGAFLGCLLGGFWMVPYLGLPPSLLLAGAANVLVSLLYIGNRLKGPIEKPEQIPQVKTPLKDWQVFLLVFCSGLVCISLEIIWFRIWALTIGGSSIVFPMVLSLFVLGLGYGGLTIKELSYRRFKRELSVFLLTATLSYAVVSILPQWTSKIRVLFVSMPHTYLPFYALTYLVLALVLLPFVIPLGRILPMGYAFLKKDRHNYGYRCGLLYFINTMGTFFGAIFLSYLFLYFLNINHLYLLNIFIFLGFYLVLVVAKEKKPQQVVLAAAVLGTGLFHHWSRDIHLLGNFRQRQYGPQHAKSLFSPYEASEANISLALQDGPNTTAGVMEFNPRGGEPSRSIMVNGKSDSNSHNDFSTTTLSGLIPYLNQYHNDHLVTSVVGLGTGVTVGVLSQLAKVQEVDLLEISSVVAEMNHYFDQYNYSALKSPKVNTHIIDAFKFYVKNSKKYNIIISEPTNPWVVGVENLYTPYFYQLAKDSLAPDGVLAQWLQMYSTNRSIMNTVIKNMSASFAHIRAYQTAAGDLLLLGQNVPGQLATQADILSSADGPFIRELLQKNIIPELSLINYLEVMSPQDAFLNAQLNDSFNHSLLNPSLSMRALKPFYIGTLIAPQDLRHPLYVRHIDNPGKKALLQKMSTLLKANPDYCARGLTTPTRSPLCETYKKDLDHYNFFLQQKIPQPQTLTSYNHLRNRGILAKNREFLQQFSQQLIQQRQENKQSQQEFEIQISAVWSEMERDGLWDEFFLSAQGAYQRELITEEHFREATETHSKRRREISANLSKLTSHFTHLEESRRYPASNPNH